MGTVKYSGINLPSLLIQIKITLKDSFTEVRIIKILKNSCKGKGKFTIIYLFPHTINFYHLNLVLVLLWLPGILKKVWLRNGCSHFHLKLPFAWRWLCMNYIHLCSESLTVLSQWNMKLYTHRMPSQEYSLGWISVMNLELYCVCEPILYRIASFVKCLIIKWPWNSKIWTYNT